MAYTGIARFILKGRLAGQVATRNMFTGQVQLAGTDTDQDVAQEYITAIFNCFKQYIHSLWSAESIEVQHWDGGEWITMSDEPFTLAGTGTGEMAPFLVAAVLVAKAVGKRLIGRKFWSGLLDSATDVNTFTSGALAALAAGAAVYFDFFTTSGGSTYGPGIQAKDNTFHSFSSAVVSSLVGTMRRRKPGLGI